MDVVRERVYGDICIFHDSMSHIGIEVGMLILGTWRCMYVCFILKEAELSWALVVECLSNILHESMSYIEIEVGMCVPKEENICR